MVMNIYPYISECELHFGENCKYPCDIHCINRTCDRMNGSCLYGCHDAEQCGTGIHFLIWYIFVPCTLKTKEATSQCIKMIANDVIMRDHCLFGEKNKSIFLIMFLFFRFFEHYQCNYLIGRSVWNCRHDGWRMCVCYHRICNGYVCYTVQVSWKYFTYNNTSLIFQ